MRTVVSIRVPKGTEELLRQMAKAQGKTVSAVAGELLQRALRNEVKESRDLERFVSMLAGLSASLQQVVLRQDPCLTREDLIVALTVLGNYWFLDATKRQKFVQELEEKLGGGR